ncbi:hypothetical protein [Nocardia australiensis]|uniref:hypothetical protein n=1 Tax=Nocardia australiensis TaxID=2887191 RepID=UPI001D1508DD|nr:hypothetical protein [Nocardia australiensis]
MATMDHFYSGLVKQLSDFLIDFSAALSKLAFDLFWEAGDIIDALASAAKAVVDQGLNLGAALMAEKGLVDQMSSVIDHPKSYDNNQWPQLGIDLISIDTPNSEKWSAR